MTLLEGKKRQEMFTELKVKFWPTYKVLFCGLLEQEMSLPATVLEYTGCTHSFMSIFPLHPADGLAGVAGCTGRTVNWLSYVSKTFPLWYATAEIIGNGKAYIVVPLPHRLLISTSFLRASGLLMSMLSLCAGQYSSHTWNTRSVSHVPWCRFFMSSNLSCVLSVLICQWKTLSYHVANLRHYYTWLQSCTVEH